MDDVVRRREARRRKLLLGSQDRLQKIERLKRESQENQEENSHELPINQRSIHEELQSSTQVNSEHKQVTENIAGGKAETSNCDHQQANSSRSSVHNDTCNHGHLNSHIKSTESFTKDYQRKITKESSSPSAANHNEYANEREGLLGLRNHAQSSVPYSSSRDSGFVDHSSTFGRSETLTRSERERSRQGEETDDVANQSLVSLQTVVFILLALLTRMWIFTLSPIQSVIVLFLATKVLLFYLGVEKILPPTGRLQMAASLLALKGVSQETIAHVQRWLGILQGVVRDLSTFLFVFIMIHALLEQPSAIPLQSPAIPLQSPVGDDEEVFPEW